MKTLDTHQQLFVITAEECGELTQVCMKILRKATVDDEWNKTIEIRKNVELDYYVVMPNHFHGIIIIKDVETSRRDVSKEKLETGHRPVSTHLKPDSLGSVIGQFKSICTKRIRKLGIERFKWQTRFYDHIIRNENDLRRIRTYIQNNPLKWELDEYYKC